MSKFNVGDSVIYNGSTFEVKEVHQIIRIDKNDYIYFIENEMSANLIFDEDRLEYDLEHEESDFEEFIARMEEVMKEDIFRRNIQIYDIKHGTRSMRIRPTSVSIKPIHFYFHSTCPFEQNVLRFIKELKEYFAKIIDYKISEMIKKCKENLNDK